MKNLQQKSPKMIPEPQLYASQIKQQEEEKEKRMFPTWQDYKERITYNNL